MISVDMFKFLCVKNIPFLSYPISFILNPLSLTQESFRVVLSGEVQCAKMIARKTRLEKLPPKKQQTPLWNKTSYFSRSIKCPGSSK